MSSTPISSPVPIARRDLHLPAATDETEETGAIGIVALLIGGYLLVMVVAWRLVLAARRLIGAK